MTPGHRKFLQIQEFLAIRKELIVRKKINRNIKMHNNRFFKIINKKPEIRYRVNRRSIRKLIEKMISKENILK